MCRDSEPPGKTLKRGPIFTKYLYEQGVIGKNLFAFYMESAIDEDENKPSFVDFG